MRVAPVVLNASNLHRICLHKLVNMALDIAICCFEIFQSRFYADILFMKEIIRWYLSGEDKTKRFN